MTTPSEPTGTKLTDVVSVCSRIKAEVCGISARGQAWVNRNMYNPQNAKVIIDIEHLDEIENLIKADGLTVSRK